MKKKKDNPEPEHINIESLSDSCGEMEKKRRLQALKLARERAEYERAHKDKISYAQIGAKTWIQEIGNKTKSPLFIPGKKRVSQTAVRVKKVQQPKQKPAKSDIFTRLCKSALGIEVVREYLFHDERKWRFDYAIPDGKIAVEVEGGVWTGGRHTRSKGFLGDIEKYNAAALLGWRVFRVVPDSLNTGATIELIRRAMKQGQ